jgi:hypothetical protein
MKQTQYTKEQNKLIGIISRDFNEMNYYQFVIDCYQLGITEFQHEQLRTEFQQKVLNVRNYSGYTDKPKYSSMMESKMNGVYNSIIFPILRKSWNVVMDRLDQLESEYCGYCNIDDYDEYSFNIVDLLMSEDIVPMSWGGEEDGII